jgi:hypothetical protein
MMNPSMDPFRFSNPENNSHWSPLARTQLPRL